MAKAKSQNRARTGYGAEIKRDRPGDQTVAPDAKERLLWEWYQLTRIESDLKQCQVAALECIMSGQLSETGEGKLQYVVVSVGDVLHGMRQVN
ncbi:MAG: hypothetical protein GY845_06120 [Planctomycetes bacterium]|nr:hypothetical protein [Planctomycetota bacterium]